MIEKKIVNQKVKEFQVHEFISKYFRNAGVANSKLQRTPLGEKIIINAARPGIIVGRKGENIRKLTELLKKTFKFDNPQIEINEVEEVNLDAKIVAEKIAMTLERFGTTKFKGVGHKVMADVMGAGARGVEIILSGKIPSARAKRWRFYQGYLKKCGDIALTKVKKANVSAQLKTGIIGVQVRIMPPEIRLPDSISIGEQQEEEKPEKQEEKKKEVKTSKKKAKKKTTKKKKAKKTSKKEKPKDDEKDEK